MRSICPPCSALLAVVTVPLMIAVPRPTHTNEGLFWAVAIWMAFSGYVFSAIIRSAYHFIAIMEAAYGDRLRG
jgi:hypothetical protein